MADKQSCNVCGGKGGWKIPKATRFDTDWQDCFYCEGYGFHDKSEHDDDSDRLIIFKYNRYKSIITKSLDSFCTVISYSTYDKCKKIEISILPTDKDKSYLGDFVKTLLKFGGYNNRMEVEVNQVFHFNPKEEKANYYWKIALTPTVMEDLDGFIDLLKIWEKNKGKREQW